MKNVRIVHFSATNVKRLEVVEFEPDRNLVVVAGDNGEGKTSLMDAILYALSGTRSIPGKPIRTGAERADIRLDLDDFVVELAITAKGEYLKVTSKDGLRYTSPQAMLNGLAASIMFDPAEWLRQKPKKQHAELMALVGLDTEENRTKRKTLFDRRTDVSRDLRRQEGALEALGTRPDVPDCRPRAEVFAEYEEAQAQVRTRQAASAAVHAAKTAEESAARHLATWDARVEAERERLVGELSGLSETHGRREAELSDIGDLPSLDGLRDELAACDFAESARLTIARHCDAKSEADKLRVAAGKLTKEINALDEGLATMLRGASFPVEGLSVGEDDVLFNDLPLAQASQAEQLRVALSIAMRIQQKKDRRLAIVRILDGSLLDDKSMDLVRSMAEEHDFQVWIERIEKDGASIVIEDGRLAATATAEA